MEIEFDHIPKNLYISDFYHDTKFPLCSFSKTPKKDYKHFPNEPSTGFTFATGSYEGAMIIDPRGFSFNISYSTLVELLSSATVINGEIIGEYRWIWKNNKFIIEKEEIVKTMDIASEDAIMNDVEFNGDICKEYRLPNGEYGVYIGRCFNIKMYNWDSSRYTGKACIMIGDDAKNAFLEYSKLIRNSDVSNIAEHIFVVFTKNNIKYVKYKKFVSFGDKGFSDIITPDNVHEYRKTLILNSYSTEFIQYFLYDMSKYYYNLSSKRICNTIVELSKEDIDKIMDVNPKMAVYAYNDDLSSCCGTIQIDRGKWLHVRSYDNFTPETNLKLCIPGIKIHGKKNQEFIWDCFHQQDL